MWSYTEDLDLGTLSKQGKPALIFKHSNRCSVSSMALSRIKSSKNDIDKIFDFHLIDVIKNRPLSLKIAEETRITHESPQIIIIQNGEVLYSASHFEINSQSILSVL